MKSDEESIHPFASWHELKAFAVDRFQHNTYPAGRFLANLIAADIVARLAKVPGEWMAIGSIVLPVRPPESLKWPSGFSGESTLVEDRYVLPRHPFDIDLCPLGIAKSISTSDPNAFLNEYKVLVETAVREVIAPTNDPDSMIGSAVNGHVQLSIDRLIVNPDGQLMATVLARPVERSGGAVSVVDAPFRFELDIKPPWDFKFFGRAPLPGAQLLPFQLPGFKQPSLILYPNENQLADKLWRLAFPPYTNRQDMQGPWHHYKDLFDLYFMIKTCRFDGAALYEAISNNKDAIRRGCSLPLPYQLFGDEKEPFVPWAEGCAELQVKQPHLSRYPSFRTMVKEVQAFVNEYQLRQGAVWEPSFGWVNNMRGTSVTSGGTGLGQQLYFPGTAA